MFDHSGMDRRTLLARALMLAGASAAASACTSLEPLGEGASASMTSARMITLSAVADTMIPTGSTVGALDVNVPALFAGLMENWAAPATRTSLMGALDRIAMLPGAGGTFAGLDPATRKTVLQRFDSVALTPSGAPKLNPFGPEPATDPAYQRLKQLILTLFYLSQPALTQELAYTHVPGRWDPSVPVTSATRPQGGPGMF